MIATATHINWKHLADAGVYLTEYRGLGVTPVGNDRYFKNLHQDYNGKPCVNHIAHKHRSPVNAMLIVMLPPGDYHLHKIEDNGRSRFDNEMQRIEDFKKSDEYKPRRPEHMRNYKKPMSHPDRWRFRI